MSQSPKTIAKQLELDPAQDFYRLRREGIGHVAQMASGLWTDYNVHDPGITILEALCYAITDLAYRTGWDIRDLLAPATPSEDAGQPFPDQAFFTAREILTVNPATPNDFRRLLIDLETVRNAWVHCKECACEAYYYACCENDQLKLSPAKPEPGLVFEKVEPRGLYDVLLELEADPEAGDLNDHKVEYAAVISGRDGEDHPLMLELRFPVASLEYSDIWASLLSSDTVTFSVELKRLGATRSFDVFTDPSLKDDEDRDDYLRRHWKEVLYLDLEVKIKSSGKSFVIRNVTLRVFGNAAAKSAATAGNFREFFKRTAGSAVVRRYRDKMKKAKAAIANAKAALLRYRNLAEDYCCVKVVGIEEVAVCADVEVRPDADIELVQARIWFEIEQYFNPAVPFYTLQELMEAGMPVETIFNGPALDSGFIRESDLDAAMLKSELRVSDLLNRLMDIDGVIAINQLQLTKYDAEGNIAKGAADPVWNDAGNPVFDANKSSASWLLYLKAQHQPRLYLNGSRFLFYKNGLPFRARMDEVLDTLTQLRGEAERPKGGNASQDLPIPAGQYRDPEDYLPVQYSFPLVYGIGPEGLPSHVSEQRRAQAKQLKAYLMVFEQLLGNELAQLAHCADLFSLDPGVKRTYFVKEFTKELIGGFDEISNGLDKAAVETIVETEAEFHDRRNRFLDHLLARFGEQFSEYTLLLTNIEGRQVALDQLIEDKIAFLRAYPLLSHDRARAFNYSIPSPFDYGVPELSMQVNQPAIKKRVNLLLGHPDLSFDWTVTDLGVQLRLRFQLADKGQTIWTGYLRLADIVNHDLAKLFGHRAVLRRMSLPGNYKITQEAVPYGPDKFVLRLKGSVSQAHGRYLQPFDSLAEAESMRDKLIAWSASERMLVVEHLLLRPKFPGDTLYPACSEGGCKTCGDADPYSFRLTFVMPGWAGSFESNMQMRDFADRTIRQETPSHLLGKICWIDQDVFEQFEDAWYQWLEANAKIDWTEERLYQRIEAILAANLLTKEATDSEVCHCAAVVLAQCGSEFYVWLQERMQSGIALEDWPAFVAGAVSLCPDLEFNPGTGAILANFLTQRYGVYMEVSYRLAIVVNLLAKLNNIYPAATLHDWDEGNDQNPVRLGKTALGIDGGV